MLHFSYPNPPPPLVIVSGSYIASLNIYVDKLSSLTPLLSRYISSLLSPRNSTCCSVSSVLFYKWYFYHPIASSSTVQTIANALLRFDTLRQTTDGEWFVFASNKLPSRFAVNTSTSSCPSGIETHILHTKALDAIIPQRVILGTIKSTRQVVGIWWVRYVS